MGPLAGRVMLEKWRWKGAQLRDWSASRGIAAAVISDNRVSCLGESLSVLGEIWERVSTPRLRFRMGRGGCGTGPEGPWIAVQG